MGRALAIIYALAGVGVGVGTFTVDRIRQDVGHWYTYAAIGVMWPLPLAAYVTQTAYDPKYRKAGE